MDASDTIRKLKSQVVYANQRVIYIQNNPKGDCAVSTCCYAASSCIKTFPSFDNKYDYYHGMNVCVSTCVTIPENGGSQ